MKRRSSKITAISEAISEETPVKKGITYVDKTGVEVTEEFHKSIVVGERPKLNSRGPATFIKRSVCGKTDEVFDACVGRHNDLKKIKAPDLNKSFWGRMQSEKPHLDLD
jgi:hypothetical protein